MKKTLITLTLVAAASCTVPAMAQDNASVPASSDSSVPTTGNYQPGQAIGSGNWMIDGRIGQAHVNQGPYNDHPTTYAIGGGYRWKVGEDLGLGVDVGYNDLGNFKLKNAFNDNPVNLKDQRNALRGWTAGVNGKINVWRGLYVSGRAGIYGWKGHGYANQDINRHDLDKVDYYAGAGVGYDISNHFGVGLAYDYYHAKKDGISLSTDTASLTAEYRF
jgi:OmpA-OmpF porin, OOP family